MANPYFHAESSVRRWKGKVEDYLEIHELLDSPKSTMNNNSVRILTHNTWFVYEILPKIFGYYIVNSDERKVDVVDIGLKHIAEDFNNKFIPTVQDYLKHLEVQPWMNNGVKPIDNPEAYDLVKQLKITLNGNSGTQENQRKLVKTKD